MQCIDSRDALGLSSAMTPVERAGDLIDAIEVFDYVTLRYMHDCTAFPAFY